MIQDRNNHTFQRDYTTLFKATSALKWFRLQFALKFRCSAHHKCRSCFDQIRALQKRGYGVKMSNHYYILISMAAIVISRALTIPQGHLIQPFTDRVVLSKLQHFFAALNYERRVRSNALHNNTMLNMTSCGALRIVPCTVRAQLTKVVHACRTTIVLLVSGSLHIICGGIIKYARD